MPPRLPSTEAQQKLAQDPEWTVRLAVAKNLATPPDTLSVILIRFLSLHYCRNVS